MSRGHPAIATYSHRRTPALGTTLAITATLHDMMILTTSSLTSPTRLSPLESNVDHLSSLIVKDMRAAHRGRAADEFRAATAAYTVTDFSSDQFLAIHRAASPYPLKDYSRYGLQSCALETFIDFLRVEGPELRELYLEFKSRGHTGCYIVAGDATQRLHRILQGCVAKHEVECHSYSSVLVEGRTYWLDFTIDQFIDYPSIVKRTNATTPQPPPSYYGALVMPSDVPFPSSPPLPEICLSGEYGLY